MLKLIQEVWHQKKKNVLTFKIIVHLFILLLIPLLVSRSSLARYTMSTNDAQLWSCGLVLTVQAPGVTRQIWR